MGKDGRGKFVQVILGLVLLAVILSPLSSGVDPTICIGDCPPGTEFYPPVIDVIGNHTVDEGVQLTFPVNATDLDSDPANLTFLAEGAPLGSLFLPEDGGNYTFSWTPDFTQAGMYVVNFTVTDETDLLDSEIVSIEVINVNRPPVLEPIASQVIAEGEDLTLPVLASDPDGDALSYGAIPLPSHAVLNETSGIFSWTPDYDQGGEYWIIFTVQDGDGLAATREGTFQVLHTNRPPVLDPIGNQTVAEGTTLNFTVTGSDPDGDLYSYHAEPLSQNATLDALSGEFTWTPGFEEAGEYATLFTITDSGNLSTSVAITITVTPANRGPVLDPIGNHTVAEGVNLTFTITALDLDGDPLIYRADSLPENATLNETTGVFSWTPVYDQFGLHELNITVSDGMYWDTEAIIINVTNIEMPPVLHLIGNQTVSEGMGLTFTLVADDADGDLLTYQVDSLPPGSTWDPVNGSFSWIPDYGQAGIFTIVFNVTDGMFSDQEVITITVLEVVDPFKLPMNPEVAHPPVFKYVDPQIAYETLLLTFRVEAIDLDGDTLHYTAVLPPGATFTQSGTGYVFSWKPPYRSRGTFEVVFTAGDGSSVDTLVIPITVSPMPYPTGDCILI
jgi:hypothetical protein